MTIKTNLKSYYKQKDKEKYDSACYIIGNIIENHINKMIVKGATKSEVAHVRRAYRTLVHGYEVDLVGD